MKTADSLESNIPLYAPCRKLTFNAPFVWLKKGWQDFRRARWHSLAYGAVFACIGWLLVYSSWFYEDVFLVGLFISFLLVGPALAFGLYDISQQLERQHKPTFGHERRKAFHEMGHELMLALLLGLAFVILLILISIVFNISAIPGQLAISAAVPISDAVSLSIAVIFAALFFCASAFALPMILDQDASAMTAIITSLHAVWRNKSVLALWALLILALVAVGFATALIGFVLIVPVVGYATWHAYRETIITKV
ncbi:DUF2189 domain-containing protein [Sulfuriflexus mobilis]|uniref:DUF2189 domain-containing protein n=1 Tax=Sulfuriflexus mobilis TaxID=1811807 RepID=UPI001558B164|nr:DUF2189 domain-containing protein [Sulfuriflexus mobilis]